MRTRICTDTRTPAGKTARRTAWGQRLPVGRTAVWTGGVDRASLVQGTLCFDFHQEDVCAPLWDEHTCESREKARIRAPWRGYSQSRLKQRAGPSLPDATANSLKIRVGTTAGPAPVGSVSRVTPGHSLPLGPVSVCPHTPMPASAYGLGTSGREDGPTVSWEDKRDKRDARTPCPPGASSVGQDPRQ